MNDHNNSGDVAGIRAYLQRGETRLSTIHRVAGAFVSGAGVLVLIPLLVRESTTSIVPHLLHSDLEITTWLTLAGLGVVLTLPLFAMWLLMKDLVLFYFTGHHFGSRSDGAYSPLFSLSGIQLSPDELNEAQRSEAQRARLDPDLMGTVVPDNDAARRRLDRRGAAYGRAIDPSAPEADVVRRDLLFEFTATSQRSLIDEAIKLEYSLVRHLLRARLLVLRYIKALLTTICSTAAAYGALAIGETRSLDQGLTPSEFTWLSSVLLVWAGATALAVVMPTRWVLTATASDSDDLDGLKRDPELLKYERIAVSACVFVALAALVAHLADAQFDGYASPTTAAGVAWTVVAAVTIVCLAVSVHFCGLLRPRTR